VQVNGRRAPRSSEVKFDGASLVGVPYLYRIQAGRFVQTKKVLSVKVSGDTKGRWGCISNSISPGVKRYQIKVLLDDLGDESDDA